MQNRPILCMLLGVLTSMTIVGQTAAQSIDSPYRFVDQKQAVSLFTGYIVTGQGTLELGPRSGMVFGGRYDITLSGPFALEADVSWFSKTRAVLDTVPGDTTRSVIGDADFTTLLLTGSLRFNLTGPRTYHGVQPYLAFGIGAALDMSKESALSDSLPANARFDFGTSFIGSLGGGAEIMLGQRLGLRLDARNILWKIKTPEAFLVKGEQALLLPADEWSQNFALTAGLVFRF